MASNSESTSEETPFSGEVEEIMEVVDPENSDMEESDGEGTERRVFLPGDSLDEGEMLVRDDSAYHMYHQAQTGWDSCPVCGQFGSLTLTPRLGYF